MPNNSQKPLVYDPSPEAEEKRHQWARDIVFKAMREEEAKYKKADGAIVRSENPEPYDVGRFEPAPVDPAVQEAIESVIHEVGTAVECHHSLDEESKRMVRAILEMVARRHETGE